MTGTALTQSPAGGRPPTLPYPFQRALADHYDGEWSTTRELAGLAEDGMLDEIPQLASQYAASIRPADVGRLRQRLTLLGMTMAATRPQAEAAAWVHETARLLADLPEDLLLDAIDEHQRTSRFLPTVAELRELADPLMVRRRRAAARLDAMVRYIESGQPIPRLLKPAPTPAPRSTPMTAAEIEEMNAIMARVGASTRYRPDGSRFEAESSRESRETRGPLRKPTRADYIAMGVDPAVLDDLQRDQAA